MLNLVFATILLVTFVATSVCARPELCICDYGSRILNCSSLELSQFKQSELLCGLSFTNIDISQNAFHEYPQELAQYKSVDISNNGLRRLETETQQKVEILDVSRNSISEIDLRKSFLHLRNLYATGNSLGNVSDDFLKGHCSIEHMELSENQIKSLETVTHCKSLAVLLASQNMISQTPRNMIEMSDLLILQLPHNQIRHITSLPRSLEILNLAHNEVTVINPTTLMNLASLKFLDISHNSISDLELRTFTSLHTLETLNLSGNDLIVLADGVFQGMKSLRVMDLSNNQIESLSNGAFSGLPALESLNLSVNSLTTVPALRLGNKVQEISMFFNHMRKVNDFSILALFAGTETSRFVDFGGNPFSGDDPGWKKIVSKFEWVCEDKLKEKVESFTGEERPSVRYRFHKLAHTPCPCVILTRRLWRFAACVREEGEINGRHWLKEAKESVLMDESKIYNYTLPIHFLHEEM